MKMMGFTVKCCMWMPLLLALPVCEAKPFVEDTTTTCVASLGVSPSMRASITCQFYKNISNSTIAVDRYGPENEQVTVVQCFPFTEKPFYCEVHEGYVFKGAAARTLTVELIGEVDYSAHYGCDLVSQENRMEYCSFQREENSSTAIPRFGTLKQTDEPSSTFPGSTETTKEPMKPNAATHTSENGGMSTTLIVILCAVGGLAVIVCIGIAVWKRHHLALLVVDLCVRCLGGKNTDSSGERTATDESKQDTQTAAEASEALPMLEPNEDSSDPSHSDNKQKDPVSPKQALFKTLGKHNSPPKLRPGRFRSFNYVERQVSMPDRVPTSENINEKKERMHEQMNVCIDE